MQPDERVLKWFVGARAVGTPATDTGTGGVTAR